MRTNGCAADHLADLRLGRLSADLARASADFDLRRSIAKAIEVYGWPEARERVLELLVEASRDR